MLNRILRREKKYGKDKGRVCLFCSEPMKLKDREIRLKEIDFRVWSQKCEFCEAINIVTSEAMMKKLSEHAIDYLSNNVKANDL